MAICTRWVLRRSEPDSLAPRGALLISAIKHLPFPAKATSRTDQARRSRHINKSILHQQLCRAPGDVNRCVPIVNTSPPPCDRQSSDSRVMPNACCRSIRIRIFIETPIKLPAHETHLDSGFHRLDRTPDLECG